MTRKKHPATDHVSLRPTRASRRFSSPSLTTAEVPSDPIVVSDADRPPPQLEHFDEHKIKAILQTDEDEVEPNPSKQPLRHPSAFLRSASRRARTPLPSFSSSDDHPLPLPAPPARRSSRSNKLPLNTPVKKKSKPDAKIHTRKQKSRKQPPRNPSSLNLSQDEQLKLLLTAAESEDQTNEILSAWKTTEGRARLVSMSSNVQSDSEEEPVLRSTSRRKRSLKRKVRHPEVDNLCGDDDEKRAMAESIADNIKAVAGVTTRRSSTRHQKNKVPSVRLPKKPQLLKDRLKNRSSILGKIKLTRNSRNRKRLLVSYAGKNQSRVDRPRPKRSTRNSRRAQPSKVLDDNSDSEELEILEEMDVEIEEMDGGEAEDSEDDGEEDFDDEEEDDDDDDNDAEEESESEKEGTWVRRQRRKNNLRRKITRPSDLFQAAEIELSAREQRERLDFLVKQSADIAQQLHMAMADVAADDKPEEPVAADADAKEGDAKKKDDEKKQDVVDLTGSGPNTIVVQPKPEPKPVKPNLKKEEEFALPNGANRELQPHQTEGVKWLLTLDAQGLNAILADEMGLGKTIQAVAFLASLVLSGSRGPHLVIAPKNVCEHWAAEIEGWYPRQIKVATHLGQGVDRMNALEKVLREDNFDILVTSYEVALRDLFSKKRYDSTSALAQYTSLLRRFRKIEFEYLVVDEAHRLKNDQSKLSLGIRQYEHAQRRLLLTGTPLSNNLRELWSLMNILNPRIFSSKAVFQQWFSAPFEGGKGRNALTNAEQAVIVDRLHTIIRPFFRRRVRADVCPSFTSADEVVINCPMSALQKAMSFHLQRRARERDMGILNILMSMRAVGNHPFISSSALFDDEMLTTPKFISASGKFLFLYHCLPRMLEAGHRVLIFTQFHRVLDFLEDLMDFLKIKYGRLDGLSESNDRVSQIAEFNREGSDIPVFILSTRAGGVGINLQTADTVILYDSDWNPCADLQAVSRIQRIGQKRTVHILRLVSEGSVDEIILETARHKLRTEAVAVGAGKFGTSRGAAIDQGKRQKELEYVLEKLESRTAAMAAKPNDTCPAPSASSSPESVSPGRLERIQHQKMVTDWGQKLLRVGETSLPEVMQEDVFLDACGPNEEMYVPIWLRRDADLPAAAKALKCSDSGSAVQAYKDCIEERSRVGTFSRKERAKRAQRFQQLDMFFSDMDSENEWNTGSKSSDPSASVDDHTPESSDDDFDMEFSETEKKKRVASKADAPMDPAMKARVGGNPPPPEKQVKSHGEARSCVPVMLQPSLWPKVASEVGPAVVHTKSSAQPKAVVLQSSAGVIDLTSDVDPCTTTVRPVPPAGSMSKAMHPLSLKRPPAAGTNVPVPKPPALPPNSRQLAGPSTMNSIPRKRALHGAAKNAVAQSSKTVEQKVRNVAPSKVASQGSSGSKAAVKGRLASTVGDNARVKNVAQKTKSGSSSKSKEVQAGASGKRSASRSRNSQGSTLGCGDNIAEKSFPKESLGSGRASRSKTTSVEDRKGSEGRAAGIGEMVFEGDKKADDFPSLVRYLQQVTQVADIDFLVDALLECDGNIDAAADYIYSNI